MQITTVNSAAGTVLSNHKKTRRKDLIRYQISLAILNTMLHGGELTEELYTTACGVLACHYGLDRDSIFR